MADSPQSVYGGAGVVDKPSVADGPSPPLPDVPAKVALFFDEGDMQAEAQVSPPQGSGAPLSRAMLDAALAAAGVVHGIDTAALERLEAPLYDQRVVVARGTPAQNGENGVVTELFSHEPERAVTQREDGTIDYRELGLIRDLKAGTTVCEIVPPTMGVDGRNTKGQPVKARNGEKAAVPMGENMVLSEDGTRVLTAAAGNLVYRNGRFTIETVYRVQDVDYDIGNITFSGDVKIGGDVKDGFDINAGGDVTVHGQVGNCNIKANNITLDQGVNGMGKAAMEARQAFKAGFVENCKVLAGEKVLAKSLINSYVECEGDVDVSTGKGVICGGKVMAFGSVAAREIGNESNTLTVVSMGIIPKYISERKNLQTLIAELDANISELEKNAAYIEKLISLGKPVPPERVQKLKRAQIALPMSEKKKAQLEQQLAELEARMADVGNVQLTARIINAPTKVSIGTLTININETRRNCRVFKSAEGEIVIGTKQF